MFDTLFEFITVSGTSAIERITSGLLSLLVAAGSTVGGYAGDTSKMLERGFNKPSYEITVGFELDVAADELTKHLDELNTAFEKEVEYSNERKSPGRGATGIYSLRVYQLLFNNPLEFKPMKLTFPSEDIPGIYEKGKLTLDGSLTLTYSKDTKSGSLSFDIEGAKGDHSLYFDSDKITFSPDLTSIAVEFLDGDIKSVYAEHFASLAYTCDTDAFLAMLLDENGRLSEILDGFSFYSHSLPKTLTDLTVEEVLTILEDVEFVSLFMTFVKEYTKPLAKNFAKRTVDGCDARIFELTGKEYLDYRIGLYDHGKEDSVIDAYKALTDYVHKTEALSFLAESELFEHTDKKEIEDSIATYARRRREIANAMNNPVTARPVPDVSLLRFYYANSKLKHTVYEKDGDTCTRIEFTVARSEESSLVTLKINTVISPLKGEAPTLGGSAFANKEIDGELFDNKLSQKTAQRKGVKRLEITWNSKMTSGAESPEVSDTAFKVIYRDNDTADKTSTAHLVDGSVYLPLRQLTENAGYEVSWDAETYKAYVTVDGKKIEMTGRLIDSKTYVKVRDFEKLGATVTYSEKVHYANAHDDFFKECSATVSFGEG